MDVINYNYNLIYLVWILKKFNFVFPKEIISRIVSDVVIYNMKILTLIEFEDLLSDDFFKLKINLTKKLLGHIDLRLFKKQSYDLCIQANEHDGIQIKYVQNQTNELCMKSIEKTANAISYITNQDFLLEIIKKRWKID